VRRIGTAAAALLTLGALGVPPAAPREKRLAYPAAPREDVTDAYHGTRVADPYRWLERLDGARTIAWLRAEKRVTSEALARLPDRAAIRRRLEALSRTSRTEVPWREAGRLFFLGNSGRDQQPALFVQEDARERPRTVLDPGALSRDGSIAVGEYAVSPDGRLLAYRTAPGGADLGDVHVRELGSGRELVDVVHGVLTAVCWTRDARGFFYVRPPASADASGTAARIEKEVRYHALGDPQARDRLVHEWPQGARWVYCMASEDGRWALLVAEQGTESELWAIALGDPRHPDVAAPPTRLLPDFTAFHTPIDFVGDTLYLRTNLGAARGRVVSLDLHEGAAAAARAVVPDSADVIVDAVISGDRLVLHELADVKSRLLLFTLGGAPAGEVALPGIGAVGWPLFGRRADPELFLSFESFLAPRCIYRFDVRTGASAPFLRPRVPFDASAYTTRQVFYTSKDGTRVPMFVTTAQNLTRDGAHPTLLTAYGGYGATTPPKYDPALPLWLERGGVWAVANIRGGGEYGEEWHRAGMLAKKQNGFDDFIAAAEYLIAERYTTADRLGIYGHSNGGLLVGAVLTQRPDLFGAAVANAGHYDMLRYPKFTVGAGWVSEYGSPDDPDAFRALHAYSPLHNVRPGVCYPATLLLAADHDDRVVPSHSYKFAAALQSAQACAKPILLRVARNASHGYASREAQIAERADMWTFLVARLK
jgi:prolyl oligopeptidase